MADTVADVLLARLREWGVRQVFGYPGDGINGLLAAWGRAGNDPQFVQARHEEMAAFEAVGFAKFSGRVAVCAATSGPGAIHLLNGLYDAKLDHVPVVAIVGQTERSAMGGSYQQEVDLLSLFKDVCSDYVQMCTVPQQLPNLIDRAIRTAASEHAPTALIFPSDVLELPYEPPAHAFKQVPSSLGMTSVTPQADDAAIRQAADILNAGEKVALLVGQGARGCVEELTQVADALGAGAAKALLGKDVLPDDLPWVTGSIGLLGTIPSYKMMMDCDTLLTVGSNFPYTQFLPELDQARAIQIDRSGKWIGMRYPYELNLVGDAKTTLQALIPLLDRKDERKWRESIESDVSDWWQTVERRALTDADPVNPMRIFHELSTRLPSNAIIASDSGSAANWYARHLRFTGDVRGSLSGTLATMGPGVPYVIGAKWAHPDRPAIALVGDGAMQMNGLAELITVARYWQQWDDPRLIVAVLHNNDLNQVTWEMRAMEGSPKFAESQTLPDIDYAAFARGLGLHAVNVATADDVGPAWDQALAAGRPSLLDIRCDPDVPPIPPHATFAQVKAMAGAVWHGDEDSWGFIKQGIKQKVQQYLPGEKAMTGVDLPTPVLRAPAAWASDADALCRALTERVDGEVRFDVGTRAAYSTDASNFRQVPIGVVVPRTIEAAAEAVAVCRAHGAPVLSRGGGTSLAGQCTNTAVMIDWAKYCHRLLAVDPDARTCVVEPGIVLDVLNDQLTKYGLRYGPEPATHPNCTLGGMIGNNSCGATAQRTGKVVDNIARLDVLLYDGTRFWCGETSDEQYVAIERRGDRQARVYRQLRALRDTYADEIRARFPDIPRRVSGYNLDSLLPEHQFDVAGLLVGSESTLVTVLRAELELVPVVKQRSLVVLGFDSIMTAADAVPAILPHEPIALEGLDHRLIHDEQIKGLNPDALGELPKGSGYLMVQFGGDTQHEADQRGRHLLDALGDSPHDPAVAMLTDPKHEDELWEVREAGLGATAHVPGEPDTWEGWEDSAVHPDRLGDYLRDLEKLYEQFGYADQSAPSLYGHFGQGCVHTRIPFGLTKADGVAKYRDFLEHAADLVVRYGGSLSGEHGDGQTRGELLPRMFGDTIMRAFGALKAIFDPDDRMNPGKTVAPARLDEHLRLGGSWAPRIDETRLHFAYPEDDGSFIQAANRCVGVGKCRQHSHDGGAVMCPSYQATQEEEHSTRGRSRLLFEMLHGHPDSPIGDGWRSEAVKDALDLCLSCKGCKSDCPVDVDMATYKAEFLAHHYRGRLRPRAHYAMGWLPLLATGIARARLSRVINALSHAPLLPAVATRAAGLENREIPLFAGETLQQWWSRRGGAKPGLRGTVLLWPDTFTNTFHPHIGQAAVGLLEAAGWTVTIPTEPVCCGLTWISTGQLDTAKRVVRRTVDQLAEHVRAGGLVLGLEPSCTAVFRSDAPDLFPDDLDVARLRDQTVTLAELLTQHTGDWQPPDLQGTRVISQVHCHHHAVLGDWQADQHLLERAHAEVDRLESGCCGLAGNFGFERGHLDVSRACAEAVLLPALRAADPDTVVLADGFSCRTQIHELDSGHREAIHLAELLDRARTGAPRSVPGDLDPGDRTPEPGPLTRAAAVAVTVGAVLAAGWGVARALERSRARADRVGLTQ